MWNVEVTFDAAHRAVLSAGKPLVYVCPPAGWALCPLFAQFEPGEGLETLLIVPNPGDVLDAVDALAAHPGYVHGATGLARTERLVRSGVVSLLVATPSTLEALVGRSALNLDGLKRIVWAWPERAPEAAPVVDGLLADTRDAQRIITTTEESAAADWIQRHARRAPVAVHSRPPDRPAVTVRYATIGATTRSAAVQAVIEAVNPERAVVWMPGDDPAGSRGPGVTGVGEEALPPSVLVVLGDLPTAAQLDRIPATAQTVVLVRPSQLAYLRRLARVDGPVRISREPDRIRERTAAIRRRLRAILEEDTLAAELGAIEPLLDDYDPALIAAAALRDGLARSGPTEAGASTWTKIHLSAGRKDRIGPRDVVGALVNAVGLAPDDVGRIDMQDRFTLVDIRPDDAPRVVQGLTGQNLRGVRITARLDRR